MAVKKVLDVRDPRLRQVAKPVSRADKRVKKLLQDLEDTLRRQSDPEGVGLAAPQIGVPLRVFVMRNKGKIVSVINPEIVKLSKKTNDPVGEENGKWKMENGKSDSQSEYVMEGCLSLPHYYGPVRRSWSIKLKYQFPKLESARPASLGEAGGNWQLENTTKSFKGFPAQIVQHELDHLNGKLFIDRLFAQKRQLFKLKKGKWHEVDLP